ncbi:MAG: FG-GAP-like repeat-containing protein, partial [bacterium]|nr:FG-GAP-like repeat-containing protein [bacterium]
KAEFKINFPADYAKPIEVKLDGERAIQITDANGGKYDDQLLTEKMALTEGQDGEVRQTPETKYLKYSSGRKSAYYAYQKDQAQGERKLKHWTVYQKSDGQAEQESYVFQNAKLKPGLQGEVQVYYFGDQQIQNEKTMADVEPSLLERAQRTIQKEAGEDILNNGQKPDFIIPEPYYIDKDGKTVALKWEIDAEKNSINLNFTPGEETYPIALDPTLQFTVPGQSNTATTIDGEISSSFGFSMTSGDFNADGRLDLVVGAQSYSSNTGRVYIFYNNESIPSSAVTADVIIDGESAGGLFGHSFAAGDFNNDGRIDLAVSAHYYSSEIGRVYVFYNDGYFPATSAAADVEITGESAELFGYAIAAGDFNADGKTDLAVGANWYSSNTGRAYIFYNDGSIPTDAASADVIITGEATSNYFGRSIISGDFNADGKTDLAVGSLSVGGRICIFYNDGSYSNSAATADVVINAETSSYFGQSITVGDFNADGKTDLAVGAYRYSTDTGRAYIFYADGANNFGTATCTGSLPTVCLSADADVVITGETTSNYFGVYLTAGDFNADGKTDLAVGANSYSSSAGRAYIFYNDGSIPTAAASADVIITGENSSSFGLSMTVGDFNADGKVDLVV